MKFVEVYKFNFASRKQEVLVKCFFDEESNTVLCSGDDKFVNRLKTEGIIDYFDPDHRILFFPNGLDFLEQLKFNFKTPYLFAGDVEEKSE